MNALNNVTQSIERKWLRRELAEKLEYRLYSIFRGSLHTNGGES
jgi:hypothetical protein